MKVENRPVQHRDEVLYRTILRIHLALHTAILFGILAIPMLIVCPLGIPITTRGRPGKRCRNISQSSRCRKIDLKMNAFVISDWKYPRKTAVIERFGAHIKYSMSWVMEDDEVSGWMTAEEHYGTRELGKEE